jgi:lipopolysaccharide export system protein LptA
MSNRTKIRFVMALTACLLSSRAGFADVPAGSEATISSDEMELLNNGAMTIFSGHVVLERPPYVLKADRMTREKTSGVVQSQGHIVGTWTQENGQKTVAEGSRASYVPGTETTELWGNPRVRHWDNAADMTPLEVTADRFIAQQREQMLYAKTNVWIRRGTQVQARSEEGQLDQAQQVVQLTGRTPVQIDWADAQGTAHFTGERAVLYLSPRHARLMDNVKGHIVPAPR